MTYIILETETSYYNVMDTKTKSIVKKNVDLEEANKFCWSNRNSSRRYQVLANSSSGQELTFWKKKGHVIIPNGYSTIKSARLDIIDALFELCHGDDFKHCDNPLGDFSVIDTFTTKEVPIFLNQEQYPHPDLT